MSFSIVNPLYPKPARYQNAAVASQALTVTSTAAVSFAAFADTTQAVMFDIQGADTYATVDTTTPGSGTAHILYQRTNYTWSKAMATAAKFKATTTTNCTIVASELQV